MLSEKEGVGLDKLWDLFQLINEVIWESWWKWKWRVKKILDMPLRIGVGFPGNSAGKVSTCNAGDPDLIPGLGRFPGEGIGYPLQYSRASLIAQAVKNPPSMPETWVHPWVGKIPLRKAWQLKPVFFPGESPWTEELGGVYGVTKGRTRLSS